jgi:glutathione S-transferase
MQLYGSSFSPFVRKVLAFAAEKGIELHVSAVRPGDPDPAFRACSPFGKIPGFRDGDFELADSSAIVAYLDATKPEPNLIPAEPRARARTIWYDEFADTILTVCAGKMFFNRIVAPLFFGRPGDEAVAAAAEKDELPPILDHLESVAPESGFLVEDRLTLADIAVASPFVNLGHLGIAPDPARHPKLAAYVGRILARPSFAPWIEKEKAQLAQARAAA